MNTTSKRCFPIVLLCLFAPAACSQISIQNLESISTPDTVKSPLGPLEFKNGVPTEARPRSSTTIWI